MTEIEHFVARGLPAGTATAKAADTRAALVKTLPKHEEQTALASIIYVGVALLFLAATIGVSCARYWHGQY